MGEGSFAVGEFKGDAGRTARDRAMLLDDVVEAAFHVKVLFGYEQKGADWIQKKLDGEDNPDQGPLARRGEDGKTKYIKLSADEEQTAVQRTLCRCAQHLTCMNLNIDKSA